MFLKMVAAVLSLGLLLPAGNVKAQSPSSASPTDVSKEKPAKAHGPELLTADEEQSLAERNVEPPKEVAGGSLTTQQLTYVVIALAAAVLVLIAVR